ncbi:hypothetical protein OTK49_02435 [Vibrio coralliirubri]|uniref:hypothetical protein n=1 Tax=Vibrio coralliirubri TaxID=1516159 RepID=UPI002283D061|nr:hypothetical protein [Vibrio coralliirubri]MCY9861374.1 hypothetical protein [Vibrio coralliirubri]
MGGTLLAEHGARRHSTDEIENATPAIVAFLQQIDGITLHFQKEFRDKSTHGDLDILIGFKSFEAQSALTALLEHNKVPHSINGRVSSFMWGELQVDAIFIDERRVESAAKYFSWGDVGNILGLFAVNKGLKLSEAGLYIEENLENIGIARAFVSFEFESALEHFNLPVNEFNQGFDNFEQSLSFLSKSDIVPDLSYVDSVKRRRMRVRPNQTRYYEAVMSGELGKFTPASKASVSLPPITLGNITMLKSVVAELGTHAFNYSDLHFMAAKATTQNVSNVVLGKNYDGSLFLSMGSMYHQIQTPKQLKEAIQFETLRQLAVAENKREAKRQKRLTREATNA